MTASTWKAVRSADRAQGFLEALSLSPRWIAELERSALAEEAYHTTVIEGSRVTLEQARRIATGDPTDDVDPDSRREVVNVIEAATLLREHLEAGLPFTQAVIREAHRRLVEGVRGGAAAPGAYRRMQNAVVDHATGEVVYTPPPAYAVPGRMADLVDWLESLGRDQHPVVTAALAHYELAAIHPFLDGNGRTARLISTACLVRGGYGFTRLISVSAHHDRDRSAYYGALRSADRAGDLTAWVEYIATGIAGLASELTSHGIDALWLDGLVLDHGLSDRQRIAVATVRGKGGLTIRDYQALFSETPRRTLQHELAQLVRAGLVVAEGAGPSARYRAGPELRAKTGP
jgi:Fic family protein